MTPDYGRLLDPALGASIRVEFRTERRTESNYSVVLLVTEADGLHTVRVYDGAHGVNEMHRYTRSAGKQAERCSTTVPLVTECERRSVRSKPATQR